METEREPLLLQVLRTYNNRLRTRREDLGYTTKGLAAKVGIAESTLGNFERLQHIPSDEIIEKIAMTLGTTPEYLCDKNLRELVKLKFPHKIGRTISDEKVLEYNRYQRLMLKEEASPEKNLLLEDRNFAINKVLETLTNREREIIKRSFGIGYDAPQTLEAIGKEFNLTRARIQQIREKAIRRLRRRTHRSEMLREYL